ncbi:MAG: hypothetical protein IKC09_02410, partial [Oscillospiraceae bacterium]|nr:hypothetical protein [Oscillospiraceae bacterium]
MQEKPGSFQLFSVFFARISQVTEIVSAGRLDFKPPSRFSDLDWPKTENSPQYRYSGKFAHRGQIYQTAGCGQPALLIHFQMATSKNYFLVIWAEDFGSEKVLKTAEYFVYCGVFKTHLWGERFAQSP